MNTIQKHLMASVISIALISPAMADSTAIVDKNHSSDCIEDATLDLRKMGLVNEITIQKHIVKTKQQMKWIHHGRGSLTAQKKKQRRHLSEMRGALQELHNQMYASGCTGAHHGTSIDSRVKVMEERMGMQRQKI